LLNAGVANNCVERGNGNPVQEVVL